MDLRTRVFRGVIRTVLIAGVAVGLMATSASAAVKVTFDPFAHELPEGIALDRHGNIFVTLAPLGEIRKIAVDGTQSTFATVSPPGQGFGALGLAFDERGELFVAVATFDPATSGVYEVRRNGTAVRIPGSDQIGLPNGLAFDEDGTLYVTDSSNGAIWRLDVGDDDRRDDPDHKRHDADDRRAEGSTTTLWIKDALLAGNGQFGLPVPLGANGIAIRDDNVYVAVTETGRIVRIPIADDDRSGTPKLVADAPGLLGADGIQFDVRGNLYVAVNSQNTLVRLAPDGSSTTLATAADGLDNPASPVFGTRGGDRKTLYVTNFAFSHTNPADAHPAVLSFRLGIAGEHRDDDDD
jgi:sugar lactone lactonase YvrE